ncbi:MAG: hypothetical protein ACYDCL_07340 [Myxococcales bacterium]
MALINKCDQLERGTTKNIVGKATVIVTGTAMNATAINARLTQADTLYSAVKNAKSAWQKALAAWEAAEPDIRTFADEYTLALKSLFGKSNPILAEFGIKPYAPKKPTVETKAKSLAKRKGTLSVRGPTGKVQRSQITTEGQPGLLFVSATGEPVPGALGGPVPPGAAAPVTPNLVPGSSGGGEPSGTPPAGGNGNGTAGSK